MMDMKEGTSGPRRRSTPRSSRWRGVLVLFAAVLAGTGCNVTNPGNILDENLDREDAFQALVNGMAGDFALGLNGANSGAVRFAVLFGEIWAGTSGEADLFAARGILPADRPDYNNWTNNSHAARWVAEDGIRRMREVGGAVASSALMAEALVWAGFSNRLLGDIHCEAVFDNGPPMPRSAFYERAEAHFTEAIQVGMSAGASDVTYAAYGGRASVRLILGDLSGAVSDAGQVPTDFAWYAEYNDVAQGGRQTNAVWHETHPRRNVTVGLTWFRDYYVETGDPRVPSQDANRAGGDGISPLVSVEKYPDGTSDVPLTKGSEMRLIEAEARIRGGQWQEGLAMINAARAALGVPAWEAMSAEEAFEALIRERAIVMWLEARRGGEFYRLNQLGEFFPGGYRPADDMIIQRMIDNVNATLPAVMANAVLRENRATCWGFSEVMRNTNPNLGG